MKFIQAAGVAIFAAVLSMPAFADANLDRCASTQDGVVEKRISACTSFIDAGKDKSANLMAAYSHRAGARAAKRDYEGAIFDRLQQGDRLEYAHFGLLGDAWLCAIQIGGSGVDVEGLLHRHFAQSQKCECPVRPQHGAAEGW